MSAIPFFVVGVARSGTTLLRWMLNEHPRLTIPQESHWVVDLAPLREPWSPRSPDAVLDRLLTTDRYRAEWMDEAVVRAAVRDRCPSSYPELVSAVFGVYADQRGKPRWGDKTPWYVNHIGLLAELFPQAPFVHIIRDGREVAASLMETGWHKGPIATAADYWRESVSGAREAGRALGPDRYCEIQLEHLIAEPERVLRRVCATLGETYTSRLLDYPKRAAVLANYAPRYQRWLRHLAKPPTPGLRDWRIGLSGSEREQVEAGCGALLEQLGYTTGRATGPSTRSLST